MNVVLFDLDDTLCDRAAVFWQWATEFTGDRGPTVLASLSTLRTSGWGVSVVTNGPMPYQRDKAERLGILSHVEGFCASRELGLSKPDPRILSEAIRRTSSERVVLRTQVVWMVGDSPTADIGGAPTSAYGRYGDRA